VDVVGVEDQERDGLRRAIAVARTTPARRAGADKSAGVGRRQPTALQPALLIDLKVAREHGADGLRGDRPAGDDPKWLHAGVRITSSIRTGLVEPVELDRLQLSHAPRRKRVGGNDQLDGA